MTKFRVVKFIEDAATVSIKGEEVGKATYLEEWEVVAENMEEAQRFVLEDNNFQITQITE